MITSFTWDNGTASNPIELTNEQINKLLALAQNNSITSDVRGYITTQNGNIARSTKYILQSAFPYLNIVANEMTDSFTVYLNKSTIYEGETATISAIGISTDLLEFFVSHVVTIVDGTISENAVKNRISISGTTISVAPALENDTWTDVVTILAYPSYSTPDDPNAQTLTLTVRAVGIVSASIDAPEEVDAAETIECPIYYQPSVNSKESVIIESLTIGVNSTAGGTISRVNNKWYLTTGNASAAVNGNIILNLNTSIESVSVVQATTTVRMLHIPITTVVLDQRGSITDSVSCFLTPTNHGCYAGNDDTNNVLCWIRKNSHAYVGVFSGGKLRLKQLDDTDRRYYTNGVHSDIYGMSGTSGLKPEVFVKIPPFYYRSTYVNNSLEDTSSVTEIVKIWYSRHRPSDYNAEGSGWQYWDGETLIGAYPPCYIGTSNVVNDNTCAYSFSTVDNMGSSVYPYSSYNLNNKTSNIYTWQRNKGTYYKPVGFYERNIIMLLYYGWYYDTDIRNTIGRGSSYNTSAANNARVPRPGFTDELGMRDTTPENGAYDGANNLAMHYYENEEDYTLYGSTNFWGLENFGTFEAFGFIKKVNSSTITQDDIDIISYVIDVPAGTVYGKEDLNTEYLTTSNFNAIIEFNGEYVLLIFAINDLNNGEQHAPRWIFGDRCLVLPKTLTGGNSVSWVSDTPLRNIWYHHGSGGYGCPYTYGKPAYRNMFQIGNTPSTGNPPRTCYRGPMEIIAPNASF